MMTKNKIERFFESAFPKGAAHTIAPDSDTEKLLKGISDFESEILPTIESLSEIRDCKKTALLDELETEYGFAFNPNLTEDERRNRILNLKKNKKEANGSLDFLQQKLHEAGFDNLFVFNNDPPVWPDELLTGIYAASCGDPDSVCGNESAYCALIQSGFYIVNGPLYVNDIQYTAQCGGDTYCNWPESECGHYVPQMQGGEVTYSVPNDPETGNWALVFFIASDVVRGTNGEILQLLVAEIDWRRREELYNIVLRYKPLQTWAAASIYFTEDYETGGFGNNAFGNSAFGN